MSTFKELAGQMKAPGAAPGTGSGKGHSFRELAATMTPPKEEPVRQVPAAVSRQGVGSDPAQMGTNAALMAAAMKLQQDTAFEQSRGSGAAGAGAAGARLYGDRDFREGQTFVQRRDVKTQLDAAGEAYEAARRRVGDFTRGGVSREQRDRAQEELAAAKAERDRLQREYEAVGGAPDGFIRRAMYTMKGGAKQSLGSNADAMGFAYQTGQSTRDDMNDSVVSTAKRAYEDSLWELNDMIASGTRTEEQIRRQREIVEADRKRYEALAGIDDAQRGAGEAARELAALISRSGAQDIDTAKRGMGTFGGMLVDAGASMTQMAGDMAGNVLMGTNPNAMLPFAMRAFGGGTMEARAEGADLNQQMLYGGAMAAKEAFTEKMFNIAAPFSKAYGGGSLDHAVGNAIENAVERFAATDVGKRALGSLLSYGAGAASEGLEELIGDWIEWQMPRIYGGEVDSASEVLANSLYDFAVGTLSGMAGVDQLRYTPPSISTAVDKARAGERVSNAEAEAILGDPVAVEMLEASAGVSLTEGKTKSQQRNAVREALAAMAEQERDAGVLPGNPSSDRTNERATSPTQGRRLGGEIISDEARASFGKEGQQVIDVVMERSMLQGMRREQAYGAFSRAYHQGMTGQKMTAVDGLTGDGLRMAYKAGKNDAAASLAREKRAAQFASVAGEDAGLVLDDYVKETMETGEYDTLNRTAKRLGLRVRFVDELAHGANADITGEEVRIQKDNENPVRFLLGHEITHRLQELAPEAYRTFRDLAMQGENERTLAYQHAYREGGVALDYEGAMDEAAADYAGVLIENGQLLENFIAENRADRTLLEWLRDVIRELVDKLTGKERKQAQTAERALTRALDEAAKQAQIARASAETRESGQSPDAIYKGTPGSPVYPSRPTGWTGDSDRTDATKNKTAAQEDDGARYSLNPEFNKQFDAWLASGKKELPGSGRFLVGTTSDVLKSIGVSDYKIYWSGAKIAKIMAEHPNMTADVIKSVPNVLENPILVMQSQTVVNRITVFGEAVDAEGKPVLAALELSPRNKRGEVQDFAVIASAYGKNGAQRLIDESEILYVDPNKNRTNNWLGLLRLQLPSRLTSYGSIGSVTYVSRDVNGKISFGEAEGKTAMQTAFERAQEKKNDADGKSKTRFSLMDSEGRKLTPEQAEFFKDSKVRDEEGQLLIVYHGTDAEFTVFDRTKSRANMDIQGNFFSPWELDAKGYGPKVGAYYLNIKNPADESTAYRALKKFQGQNNAGVKARDDLISQGYDGVNNEGEEYIAFYPEQIKRVDNLSPTDDPDIRFSMIGAREFADAVIELQNNRGDKSDAQVRREIVRLTEEFREQLMQAEEQTLTDRASVRRAGRKLIKEFGADMKPGEIADDLQMLYDYMAGGEHGTGEISYGRARELAETVARKLVDSAIAVDDTLYREFEDLRGYLRSQKIVVPEEVTQEIGDFDAYRKSTMGKLRLGTKGHANLDMVYSELCEMYPAWFDGEALAAADQLDQIVSAAEAIYSRPEYNPFDGGDMEQVVQIAASEIMEMFYDLPQAKGKQSQRMSERDRAALRREVSEQLNRQREYNEREMEKLRGKHQETITQLETGNLRKRIVRHANRMGQALLRPTDKKHVPEDLRGAAATLVEAINLESAYVWNYDEDTGKARLVLEKNAPEGIKTKRTEAFLQLREQYATLLQGIKDGDGDFMGVIDPQLAEYIDEAIRLRDKRISEMDRAELDTIWKALRAVEHSITTADKVLSEAKFERVEDWANALSYDTAGRAEKRAFSKAHPALDLETPYTFFSHFGESGTAIYKMLRTAQDKQQMLVEEVAEAVGKIVTPEQVQALQEETHEFQTERGDKLILSTSQVMELYELSKRKQAHDHLMEGGIVQPEIPKTGERKEIRRGTEPIKLSMEDLQKIAGALTEEQTALADQMQQLCVTVLAKWGNEASLQAYGYKKFTDPHYWPIKSAGEGLYQTVEKGGNQPRQIKNIGMGKATTPHANTPMDIAGLFTTFARHAADMSDYAAWLCPMEDCTRLYNYKFRDEEGATTGKSVKSVLERAAGEQARSYWENLMEDIQNGISAKSDSMSWGTMGKLVGSFKGAAVGGNMRVVIQQPTAFFRAAVVLNPADMAAGMAGGVAKVTGEDGKLLSGWEKALKYAPIAVRKDRGGFDISSPRMMTEILYDERTRLRKFNDALSAAAGKADALTWGKLWNACEHAVQRERAELEAGSDGFFRAVSEKFSDVIDQTQVVDGVLQRSNAMRSSNAVMQQATSFMGEPIMSLNLMMRAWDAWRYEKSPDRRSKALKTMGRAASALVVTNLVNAVAQSLVDAVRADDPDKDYWERFLAAFTGLDGDEESLWDKIWSAAFEGNAGQNNNVLTMIPFVKDVVSLIEGYDVARTEMEVISDVVESAQTVIQSMGGDGKRTRKYALNTLVRSAAKFFGVPVQNLERDAWGVLRTIAVETDSVAVQYEMEKAVYNLSYAGNKGRFLDVMFRALEQEDYETYDHIRNDLMQAGVVDGKAIDSGMRSRLEKKREADPAYLLPERAAELIGWRPASGSGREGQTERFDEGSLNADQYKAFSEERAELYRGYTSRLDSNRYFAELDDETREKVYDMAAKLAGDQALEKNAAGQFEMDTAWMQWAAGGAASGVDETEAILFKAAYDLSSGKDESGKAVAGLKKERTLETAEQWMPWLTDRELEYLMSQFWK